MFTKCTLSTQRPSSLGFAALAGRPHKALHWIQPLRLAPLAGRQHAAACAFYGHQGRCVKRQLAAPCCVCWTEAAATSPSHSAAAGRPQPSRLHQQQHAKPNTKPLPSRSSSLKKRTRIAHKAAALQGGVPQVSGDVLQMGGRSGGARGRQRLVVLQQVQVCIECGIRAVQGSVGCRAGSSTGVLCLSRLRPA